VTGLSTGDSHVGNRGITRGLHPQAAAVGSVVHRRPQAIHRLSTGFIPCAVDYAGTLLARRPQNLQQVIHRRPQAVRSFVTLRVCPHRYPQGWSTSVERGVRRFPPSGDRACGRLWTSVDNVGTKLSRRDVDNWPLRTLDLWQRRASINARLADDLGTTCGQPRVEPVDNSWKAMKPQVRRQSPDRGGPVGNPLKGPWSRRRPSLRTHRCGQWKTPRERGGGQGSPQRFPVRSSHERHRVRMTGAEDSRAGRQQPGGEGRVVPRSHAKNARSEPRGVVEGRFGRTPQVFCLILLVSSAIWL
jgi:hypothetical protein